MKNHNKPWSLEDIKKLVDLRNQNLTYPEIAQSLQRSEGASRVIFNLVTATMKNGEKALTAVSNSETTKNAVRAFVQEHLGEVKKETPVLTNGHNVQTATDSLTHKLDDLMDQVKETIVELATIASETRVKQVEETKRLALKNAAEKISELEEANGMMVEAIDKIKSNTIGKRIGLSLFGK